MLRHVVAARNSHVEWWWLGQINVCEYNAGAEPRGCGLYIREAEGLRRDCT
jgi:hypothetical protein